MAVQTLAIIKQSDLQEMIDLTAEIKAKQSALDGVKGRIKDLLFARAQIESGRLHARIIFKVMRNVAWRQIVVEKLGAAYAEAVKRATPGVKVCDVQVTEHGTLPLWKNAELEQSEYSA